MTFKGTNRRWMSDVEWDGIPNCKSSISKGCTTDSRTEWEDREQTRHTNHHRPTGDFYCEWSVSWPAATCSQTRHRDTTLGRRQSILCQLQSSKAPPPTHQLPENMHMIIIMMCHRLFTIRLDYIRKKHI